MTMDNMKAADEQARVYSRYEEIMRSLLVQQIRRECRISDRQIALLAWSQIGDHQINMPSGRQVKITDALYRALMAIPCKGRYVFAESSILPFSVPRARTEPLSVLRKIWKKMPRIHIEMPS